MTVNFGFIENIYGIKIIRFSDSATPESEATPTPTQESQASADAAPKKVGLKLSYDEYKNMANLFVIYMRRQEEHAEGW